MKHLMFPPKSSSVLFAQFDKANEIIERQLGIVDVSMNRNATAISQVVKEKLCEYSDIKEKLNLQTYDGASVMSGHINGV